MSLYSKIAEKLQYIAPKYYKQRFFKNLKNLNAENVLAKNVEPELLWIKDYLHRSDVFMDIGANVGAYLFQLEEKLHHHHIIAFEPNKKLYFRLRRIFPKLRIFAIALSDVNTTAKFKIPVINGKKLSSRGTLQTELKEDGESNAEFSEVKVIRLDDWAEIEELKKLNFIKIDVEGNELQTLRGAEKTIKKFRPTLMVEIEQRHHTEPVWNIISEVKNWHYEAYFLNRNTMQPEKLTQEFLEQQNAEYVKKYGSYINNIIFISTV